jgi:hypothetical protein
MSAFPIIILDGLFTACVFTNDKKFCATGFALLSRVLYGNIEQNLSRRCRTSIPPPGPPVLLDVKLNDTDNIVNRLLNL